MRIVFALLLMLLAAAPAQAETLNVLFVGNSYTLRNDLTGMLEKIAASGKGPQIKAQTAAKNGATLKELWNDEKLRNELYVGRRNVVVLQEQSLWAQLPETVEDTAKSARLWGEEIAKAGAKPVIFETWERQPGSFWYTDKRFGFLKTPKNMRDKNAAASAALAAQLKAQVAPVGHAYATLLKQNSKWPLYEADSHHPSIPGTYLAALVLYKTLTGRSPQETTFVPQGVNAESAAILRQIAAAE
ncbi:MAG: hydrolase family protein [Alphaproteobacteria bacterium]|jgi:hypothetical protein|nr:hydrolase family protein [Alphaproteobacteria bacterium]